MKTDIRWITFVARWIAIVVVAFVLMQACAGHEHWGMKGTYVPVFAVAVCICLAIGAAYFCKRCWLTLASPFVAGVVGAVCIGPYGGVLGLLVGLLIVLLPFGKPVKPFNLSNHGQTPDAL